MLRVKTDHVDADLTGFHPKASEVRITRRGGGSGHGGLPVGGYTVAAVDIEAWIAGAAPHVKEPRSIPLTIHAGVRHLHEIGLAIVNGTASLGEVRLPTERDERRTALVELFRRCILEVGIETDYDADIEHMEHAIEKFADALSLDKRVTMTEADRG